MPLLFLIYKKNKLLAIDEDLSKHLANIKK